MDDIPPTKLNEYRQWLKTKKALQVQMDRNQQEIEKYKETNSINV